MLIVHGRHKRHAKTPVFNAFSDKVVLTINMFGTCVMLGIVGQAGQSMAPLLSIPRVMQDALVSNTAAEGMSAGRAQGHRARTQRQTKHLWVRNSRNEASGMVERRPVKFFGSHPCTVQCWETRLTVSVRIERSTDRLAETGWPMGGKGTCPVVNACFHYYFRRDATSIYKL